MEKTNDTSARALIDFLDRSVCNFYAVDTLQAMLDSADFTRLDPREAWDLRRGGCYYMTVNDTALFAFEMGRGEPHEGFHIISSHSDSPGFRIKPRAAMPCEGGIVKLNTEVYGGPILYTWFDRPLSAAGRVILRTADPLNPRRALVRFTRPLMVIPHLAIHFNRQVNDGNPLSRQKDMLPVLGHVNGEAETLPRLLADELQVDRADILDFDLSLYPVQPATITGLEGDMICSGRLDDLSMVHASASALLSTCGQIIPPRRTRVIAVFDNEETGSATKQGAASPALMHLTRRITAALGGSDEDWMRAVSSSFMVSADNAHAVHPNYVDKHDPTNHPTLGGGPVIKINANCKYMTDADSAAVFRSICEDAGVPYQYFVNHSDVAGGSTLGNILTSQINLRGVDMGSPIWAMHSACETGSVADHEYATRAFTRFFSLA